MPVVTRSAAGFGVMSTAHELKPGCVLVVSKKEGPKGNRRIVQLWAETPQWDMGVFRAMVDLMETHHILEMNLSKMGLVFDHIKWLFPKLTECTRLLRLDLSHNELRGGATQRLVEVLGSLKCLEHLSISSFTIGADVAEKLAPILLQLEMLQSLDISSTSLTDEAIEFIARVLSSMKSLRRLDLSYNDIHSKGTKCLAEGLGTCTTLKSLILDENALSFSPSGTPTRNDSVGCLAQMLSANKNLESLKMNNCGILDRHAKPLAEAMKGCHNLRHLGLYGNEFEQEGYKILLQQTRCMPGLEVDLLDNTDPMDLG
jgi:Ran GTPase-activating protein (RanGAP) involved in mRNA processing and transport